MSKHKFVLCIVCDTPWMDVEAPFICPRCQFNGRAAKELTKTRGEVLSLKSRIESLQRTIQRLEKGESI